MYPKPLLLALLLCSVASAQPATRSTLSQFGITWGFDKEYATGQFANGDYWVVGPVTIISISPGSVSGARVKNGSMVNPSPRNTSQGYDNAMERSNYDPALNAAVDVSSSKPLLLKAGGSFVSTISVDAAAARPQIRTAAVLTVLDKVPPLGSFRPPYSGSDKSIKYNKSQLDFSKLRRLKPVMSAPSLGAVERAFERPWLDHQAGWTGRYQHPKDNMPDYGRDMSVTVGEGALMLQLDISDTLKEKLLIRYVQLGIDLYGIVQDGGQDNWAPDGGNESGRKFPILFAGVLLGDQGMASIGQDTVTHFGEDGQTFYVEETSPGVFNNGYGGYTAADKGNPEWGIRHATYPNLDNASWGSSYRACCTANAWNGFVLVARIMDLKQKWNHDALFDYQDRYITEMRKRHSESWTISYSEFTIAMWDAYRESANALTGLVARVLLEDAFDTPGGQPRKKLVKLQWDKFDESGDTTYNIYRQEGDKSLVLLRNKVADPTYEDRDVKKGLTYTYVVRAVSKAMESAPSKAVQVTP